MIICFVSVFYGCQDAAVGVIFPHSELHILLIVVGEGLQLVDVEIVAHHSRHLPLGVYGVAFLLHMGRNQHAGFAHIQRLAHTLKSRRCGVSPAASHHFQKLHVVEPMESERVVHFQLLRSVGLVPEEVQMSVGVFRVPRLHILSKSRVEHIAHDIVAMMADCGLHLLAEQWRHHFDGLLLVVIILTYGQGQLGGGAYAGDAGEELQHALGQE